MILVLDKTPEYLAELLKISCVMPSHVVIASDQEIKKLPLVIAGVFFYTNVII